MSRYWFAAAEFGGSRRDARGAAYDFARDTRSRYKTHARVRAGKHGYSVVTGEKFGAIGQAADREEKKHRGYPQR